MVARAEELVSKAQEAVDSIKADNAVAESALQRANFIISATRAEIRANASMSESDRERAQNTINAAKSEIAAILLGITLPITPVQILWINMVSAITLSLPLVFDKAAANIMQRAPRQNDEALLSNILLFRIAFVSVS